MSNLFVCNILKFYLIAVLHSRFNFESQWNGINFGRSIGASRAIWVVAFADKHSVSSFRLYLKIILQLEPFRK